MISECFRLISHSYKVEAGRDTAGDQHVEELHGHVQLGRFEVLKSKDVQNFYNSAYTVYRIY